MAIPYMGSKRGSAGKIYQTIKNFNPESRILCDLFCGGFAISEFFIKQGWRVIANDKNKYVIALLEQTIKKRLDEKECLKFVTREKFFDVLNNVEKYPAWYVGYVMCCWSFGNNQKGYLFGEDKERYKHAGHDLVVYKNPEKIKKLFPKFPENYIKGIIQQSDWYKARIALAKCSHALKTRIFELQQLEQLERLQRLERLEQLERLQRLERLERLESKLELFSTDYRKVIIPKEAVIYCDPPYRGVGEYREGNFNHLEFWNWVREKSKEHNIYISEYTAPKDFKKILEFPRNATLGSGQNKNQPNECLFTINKI